jgi:hypothetical protein
MRNVSDKTSKANQSTHFVFNNFIPKIMLLWDNVESYDAAGEATGDNIIGACALQDEYVRPQTHTQNT